MTAQAAGKAAFFRGVRTTGRREKRRLVFNHAGRLSRHCPAAPAASAETQTKGAMLEEALRYFSSLPADTSDGWIGPIANMESGGMYWVPSFLELDRWPSLRGLLIIRSVEAGKITLVSMSKIEIPFNANDNPRRYALRAAALDKIAGDGREGN